MGWRLWFRYAVTVGPHLVHRRIDLDHPPPKLQSRPSELTTWWQSRPQYPLCRQADLEEIPDTMSWAWLCSFARFSNLYVSSPLERNLCSFFKKLGLIWICTVCKEKPLFFVLLFLWCAVLHILLFCISESMTVVGINYFRLMEPRFSFFPTKYRGNKILGVHL